MKNAIKLFGIIALVTVIGFSFAACKDDDGSSDTYTFFYGGVDSSTYTASFEAAPSVFTVLANPNLSNAKSFVAANSSYVGGKQTGVSLSDVEAYLNARPESDFTSAQKTQILNQLKSKGVVVAATPSEGIDVFVAYKE